MSLSIEFRCPSCNTAYRIHSMSAGREINCKVCPAYVTVPQTSDPMAVRVLGPYTPATRGASGIPGTPIDPRDFSSRGSANADARPPEPKTTQPASSAPRFKPTTTPDLGHSDQPPYSAQEETSFNDQPETRARPYAPSRSNRGVVGSINRIIAGIGCALLLTGLFLPMFHGPLGLSFSFIDVPWKAVTVGFVLADEIVERENNSNLRHSDGTRTSQPMSEKSAFVLFVVALSVAYPLLTIVFIGLAVLQICQGRSRRPFAYLGAASFVATLGYAASVLSLNMIAQLRIVMVLLSPGLGWAVLFVGSVAVLIAGAMRTERA